MKKNSRNKINTDNKKVGFIQDYLAIFLFYLISLVIGIFFVIIEDIILNHEDLPITFSAGYLFIIFHSFNIYNLIILVRIIKNKSSISYLFLSLSELLSFIFYYIPMLIDIIFDISINRFIFLVLIKLILVIKIVQLIFVACSIFKYKKRNKK